MSAFKPATSKEGNSELYLVCIGFRNNLTTKQKNLLMMKCSEKDCELFMHQDIPSDIQDEVFKCANTFKDIQCAVIERNLSVFSNDRAIPDKFSTKDLQRKVADEFLKRCKLQGPIQRTKFITRTDRDLPSLYHCLHVDQRSEVGRISTIVVAWSCSCCWHEIVFVQSF